ncbi:MAG: ImmA/IrrE family metallo-endopeptidase [Acidimicrobiaceae bacterium]|nr:ImmA/IrrE family metallo-endopeptidase [Acidimicrobiaceae bacterium]
MRQGLTGVRADRGYSYRDLERIAASVRTQLSYSPTGSIDTLQLFDGLDIKVEVGNDRTIPIRGGVTALRDSEGYAKYDKDRGIIEILASPKTYDWLEKGHPRGGYFVAHELGHCLLHTDQLVRLAKMPKAQQAALHRGRKEVGHKAFMDTEWQANAFAAALLMPAWGLLALEKSEELSPDTIAEHFHVSDEAATYRLELYVDRKEQLLKP